MKEERKKHNLKELLELISERMQILCLGLDLTWQCEKEGGRNHFRNVLSELHLEHYQLNRSAPEFSQPKAPSAVHNPPTSPFIT